MGPYKRKGSRFYWVSYRVNGKTIFETTKTTNKKLAERIYLQRIHEAAEGRWFPRKAKQKTFEELKEKYMREHSAVHKAQSSHERDFSTFKQLDRGFKGLTLSQITPSKISDYKALRQREGKKTATISKELELLRNALNYAAGEWQWLERNPFERVKIEKPNNKVDRPLTFEEEKRLLDASLPWLKDIIVFALHTGMRRGEILSLQWEHIDFERKTAILLKTKNKEKRTVPLNETVLRLLRSKRKRGNVSEHIFTSQLGTKRDTANLLRAFRAARTRTGLETLRFHDLRHSFATRLVQSGIDLYVVKELLGHKSINVTARYAHHNPESLRHGVDALDKKFDILLTVEEKQGNGKIIPFPNVLKRKTKEW